MRTPPSNANLHFVKHAHPQARIQTAQELRASPTLAAALLAALGAANRLNAGTARADARGIRLESLAKLGDTRSTDLRGDLMEAVAARAEAILRPAKAGGGAGVGAGAGPLLADEVPTALGAAMRDGQEEVDRRVAEVGGA
jgi:hypothetical protein